MSLLYLLLIIPIIFSWYAQFRVQNIYQQYRQQKNHKNINGKDVARQLLDENQLKDVIVEEIPGYFIDHYNPKSKKITLSAGIAESDSITSLGVVAHEVGHALQDAEGYRYIKIRNKLAKRLSILSQFSPLVFIGGLWFGIPIFRVLALFMLGAFVVFTIITLPVELNASKKAISLLKKSKIMVKEEEENVQKVLRSAALTYLTGLLRQISIFLFIIVIGLLSRNIIHF
ncbi:MAG: zinc metallopeptidase [Candidatus Atribacteria bacterium]|nr:zinc metallopeptidase [Candidatus Atribacteria bacterium]